jgi:hypothetical protein
MENLDLEKLKYPIGKFNAPNEYSSEYISDKIREIAALPEKLRN